MSAQAVIAIIAIVMVFILAVALSRGGPRVTQIDRTVRREKDSHDA